MDTDSLYLAQAEKELYKCIRIEKRQEWDLLRSKDCNGSFTADACSNFFPIRVVLNTKNMKKSLDLSRKKFDSVECCVCVVRRAAVTTL